MLPAGPLHPGSFLSCLKGAKTQDQSYESAPLFPLLQGEREIVWKVQEYLKSNYTCYKYFPNPTFIVMQKGTFTYAKNHTETTGFSINTSTAMIHLWD